MFPETPPWLMSFVAAGFSWFISAVDAPEVYGDAGYDESDYGDGLDGSCKDGSAEEEETNAAEYDRGCDPGFVGPF